jgi:hypothetical protein
MFAMLNCIPFQFVTLSKSIFGYEGTDHTIQKMEVRTGIRTAGDTGNV